ncbi:MAG TPA: hypothetical protein VFE34_23460 [Dongiaceae bacterium]|jgi:hypothetical protein|nr:hypothetical protein [Dongiaceae bacterium]
MPERKKIRNYRETLHEMAKPQNKEQRKSLEGKAAKLGTEIYGEERKGKPKTKTGSKPRR